jgi:hypothetical protein
MKSSRSCGQPRLNVSVARERRLLMPIPDFAALNSGGYEPHPCYCDCALAAAMSASLRTDITAILLDRA